MQINTNKEKMTINTICYYFQEKNMSFYRCFLIFLGQRLPKPSRIGVIHVPIFSTLTQLLEDLRNQPHVPSKKKNLLNDK